MDMETTSVAELKQNLSHYLHAVEAGGEVIVTSHRRTVARLVPNGSGDLRIRPPTRDMASLALLGRGRPIGRVDGVKLLMEDRRRR